MNTAIAGRHGGSLHVLHLRDSERLCGPGKIIRDCIRANPDSQIRFHVAAFGSASENAFLSEFSRLVPVTAIPGERRRLGQAVRALTRLIRDERIDVLHSHDVKSNVIAIAAGRLVRIPVVSTVHGRIPNTPKARLYCMLDRLVLRHADLVFSVSALMARQLVNEGISPERLVLARNGIMLSEHPFGLRSDKLRSEGLLQPGDIAIGHIGRISPEKGVVTLITAFARIAEEMPRTRLVLAGDGPDVVRARRAAALPALHGRVVFLGYRADVDAVYGALDLFVLNSRTEGLPNAVLEAMAFGVPVVATAVGGTPELVHDGDTGLLIPPSDPAALTAAIRAVLRDREAAAERARRARALVEREFDMRRLSHAVNEAYWRAVATRRGT